MCIKKTIEEKRGRWGGLRSGVILAHIVVGVSLIMGCSEGTASFPLNSKSHTVGGGVIWGGSGNGSGPPPPNPLLSFSWDDAPTYRLIPWTGDEIAVPDGGSVSWKAFYASPKGLPITPTEAQAKAVLTNAPAGFDYLQWSFDSTALVQAHPSGEIGFGPAWASGSPRLGSSPMSILWSTSQTASQHVIYVWNCDAAGNRGTAQASFTVNVTARPTIVLYWNWDVVNSAGDLIVNDGDKITWSGVPQGGWSQYKDKMVRAVFTDAPSGYEYLQWSFNDPNNPAIGSTSDSTLKFVSGFAPDPLEANESIATIEHDTNRGAKVGQKVYVYNVDSAGVRPSGPKDRASAYFLLDATL